jgi:hypothetical protein
MQSWVTCKCMSWEGALDLSLVTARHWPQLQCAHTTVPYNTLPYNEAYTCQTSHADARCGHAAVAGAEALFLKSLDFDPTFLPALQNIISWVRPSNNTVFCFLDILAFLHENRVIWFVLSPDMRACSPSDHLCIITGYHRAKFRE